MPIRPPAILAINSQASQDIPSPALATNNLSTLGITSPSLDILSLPGLDIISLPGPDTSRSPPARTTPNR